MASTPDGASVATAPEGSFADPDADDEAAAAPFDTATLSDGSTLALQGNLTGTATFGQRLWAALPIGLLFGFLLVALAVTVVRLARPSEFPLD